MKACVLHAVGDLRCEEVSTPQFGSDEVLVRVRACGVCGSDIPRVFEKGTYRFPTIPGHEFAGEIADLGNKANSTLLGAHVTVFPLIPCRTCGACAVGAYAQCDDYDYLGSRSDGAFAEYVRAPRWNLLPIPPGVDFIEGAMVEPAAVALHAINQSRVQADNTVLIVGAGPIGLLVAHWAQIRGAGNVLLADIDDAKLAFARQLGFLNTFNPKAGNTTEWVRDFSAGGADVVIEASGSSAAYEQCMDSARMFGRVVLLGNPAGPMTLSQKAYWAILRKELQLSGSWNSVYGVEGRDEWKTVLEHIGSGQLDVTPLITHKVALQDLPKALEMMRDRNEFYNKVMFVA